MNEENFIKQKSLKIHNKLNDKKLYSKKIKNYGNTCPLCDEFSIHVKEDKIYYSFYCENCKIIFIQCCIEHRSITGSTYNVRIITKNRNLKKLIYKIPTFNSIEEYITSIGNIDLLFISLNKCHCYS